MLMTSERRTLKKKKDFVIFIIEKYTRIEIEKN